jgi:hypothetical protein
VARRQRRRFGAHRLRPARVPYAADRYTDGRIDEMVRLAPALAQWISTIGARLVPPAHDDPQWRVHLGTRCVAASNTAHNAILAAQAQLRRTPLDACPHISA